MTEHTSPATSADDALQVEVAKKAGYKFRPASASQSLMLCQRCLRETSEEFTTTTDVVINHWLCALCLRLCDICARPRNLWPPRGGMFNNSGRMRCYDCEQLVEGGSLRYRACGRCSWTMVPLGYTLCGPCVRDVEDMYRITLPPHLRRGLNIGATKVERPPASRHPASKMTPKLTRRVRGLFRKLTDAEPSERWDLFLWVSERMGEIVKAGDLNHDAALSMLDAAAAEAGLADQWAKLLREDG